MSDKPLNQGPHDLGGAAAGPIDTADHGMKFWEKQANALRTLLLEKGFITEAELTAKMAEVRRRFDAR
jgi:hypothetical protein